MPKSAKPSSDLFVIGMFAPLVVATRLRMLAEEAVRPTKKGRRETARMVAEKPVAVLGGALAAQKSLFDSGMKFWSDIALATNALAMTAPATMAAATGPVRRRVRGNARRLAKA